MKSLNPTILGVIGAILLGLGVIGFACYVQFALLPTSSPTVLSTTYSTGFLGTDIEAGGVFQRTTSLKLPVITPGSPAVTADPSELGKTDLTRAE